MLSKNIRTPEGGRRPYVRRPTFDFRPPVWYGYCITPPRPAIWPDSLLDHHRKDSLLGPNTHLSVTLTVNGSQYPVMVEPRRTLLDALRHDLGLTGTKKVCDTGDCGACTVIVDGKSMYACLLLAVDCDDRQITTIEGLARGNALDPAQEAFIQHDAFQCGFCTSGQIMSLRALLDSHPEPSDDQILRAVTGNLCRCGAYLNILEAGRLAAELHVQTQAVANT